MTLWNNNIYFKTALYLRNIVLLKIWQNGRLAVRYSPSSLLLYFVCELNLCPLYNLPLMQLQRNYVLYKLRLSSICCNLLHPFSIGSHSLHYHLFEAPATDCSRRAICQRETATREKGKKCAEDVHCYCVRLCSMLATLEYRSGSVPLCIGLMVLWLPILHVCCPFLFFRKLCYKPLHLFYFQWKLSPST